VKNSNNIEKKTPEITKSRKCLDPYLRETNSKTCLATRPHGTKIVANATTTSASPSPSCLMYDYRKFSNRNKYNWPDWKLLTGPRYRFSLLACGRRTKRAIHRNEHIHSAATRDACTYSYGANYGPKRVLYSRIRYLYIVHCDIPPAE